MIFQRVFNRLRNEYLKVDQIMSAEGCSLRPRAIWKRSTFVATLFSTVLFVLTAIVILVMDGLSNPKQFGSVLLNLLFCWCMFFCFVWIAHILWIMAFVIGRNIGGSQLLFRFIEQRWGKAIDDITDNLMKGNGPEGRTEGGPEVVGEEDDDPDESPGEMEEEEYIYERVRERRRTIGECGGGDGTKQREYSFSMS